MAIDDDCESNACALPLLDHLQRDSQKGPNWPFIPRHQSCRLRLCHASAFLRSWRLGLFLVALFVATLFGLRLWPTPSSKQPPLLPLIPHSPTLYDSPRATAARNFVPNFGPLEPDFDRLLKNMTLTESKLWGQLRYIHSHLYRGQRIGARHPLAKFNSSSSLKHTPRPSAGDPDSRLASVPLSVDTAFRGGDRAKHYALIAQLLTAANGEFTRGGRCPTSLDWMEKYAKLHREILTGQRPQRLTSFSTTWTQTGGLADRLLGMISSAAYSMVYDRAWVASWDSVVVPEFIYDSAWIDWSFPDSDTARHSHPLFGHTNASSQDVTWDWVGWNPDLRDQVWNGYNWTSGLGNDGQPMEQLTPALSSPWLEARLNRGLARWYFTMATGRNALRSKGLYEESIYACLMDFLFRPRVEILDFASSIMAYVALPTVFSVGIQIRTDDRSMLEGGEPGRPFSEVDHYFQCATNLSRRFAVADQKVTFFLMTDSQEVREGAKETYGSLVITSNQVPRHVHLDSSLQGNLVAAAELEIFRMTDYRIVTTCSGLGSLGALTSSAPHRTVGLTNKVHVEEQSAFPTGSACSQQAWDRISKNCMLDDAFISLDELTSTWSLG